VNPVAELLMSAALLAVVLTWAVIRPFGWHEAVIAVPAAVIAIGAGAISPAEAAAQMAELAPVLGFLAAVLVMARLCADEGLFAWCGAVMARTGRPSRLLVAVFVVASLVTAVFSLDATVVLLTPVVFATVGRLGMRARPHVYACAHLSNTASLLLPVSNLTNLLAFRFSGLSFVRFAGLMALPWLVAIAVEYVVFRRFFAADLRDTVAPVPAAARPVSAPRFAMFVVAATLTGFVVTSIVGLNPAWSAAAGATALALRAALRRRVTAAGLIGAADLPLLAFVLAMGVLVRAVVDHGLGSVVQGWMPPGVTLAGMVGIAALAAALANLTNNLPAILVLAPLTAAAGPAAVLAALIGVNIGPNLTYTGSLATMLWRRIMHRHNHAVRPAEFTSLGALATPAALVAAVVALWASLQLFGS
jgi:arsenical pump membrane protein